MPCPTCIISEARRASDRGASTVRLNEGLGTPPQLLRSSRSQGTKYRSAERDKQDDRDDENPKSVPSIIRRLVHSPE